MNLLIITIPLCQLTKQQLYPGWCKLYQQIQIQFIKKLQLFHHVDIKETIIKIKKIYLNSNMKRKAFWIIQQLKVDFIVNRKLLMMETELELLKRQTNFWRIILHRHARLKLWNEGTILNCLKFKANHHWLISQLQLFRIVM